MPDSRLAARPIGVFDSGVGGLSVLKTLQATLPHESFVYVADSGYAPYGDKPLELIEQRAQWIARFLLDLDAKALVLACNTASIVAASCLRAHYTLPVIAMEPAIKPAVLATKTGVVLVLATSITIQSESVARLCRDYGAGKQIILQACPGLVEQVERQQIGDPATGNLLDRYISPALAQGADTIVLGCTHYAFLAQEIAAMAGPAVAIAEPSAAIARRLSELTTPCASTRSQLPAETQYFTSGQPEDFSSFLRYIGAPSQPVFALPAVADANAVTEGERFLKWRK